jgi:anti-anti-sigma factor
MCAAKKKSAVTRIAIEGELTIYAAAEIKEKIASAFQSEQPLEIDLSQIGEMDTAGLQLLLLAKREGIARNRQVTFTPPSQAVLDALQLCGLSTEFAPSAAAAA